MTAIRVSRVVALAGSAALIFGLLWLDGNRAGPANAMARCNLLLSRASEPAADVLVVGSSRSGVALDPLAMQRILTAELGGLVRVDRLSLGHNPLRAMSGLLENYFEARGSPRIVVLEIMFMTERSVDRLARRGIALAPEHYIYRRDVNLLNFRQLLTQPSVAMPFTASESVFGLWSHRLRGVVLRAGALIYQTLRDPERVWKLSVCRQEDWTREAGWPSNFAFSYGQFTPPQTGLDGLIDALETDVAREARTRENQIWQSKFRQGTAYSYDFEAAYRRGEVALLHSIIETVLEQGAEIVLLPLPLYGYELDRTELRGLNSRYGHKVRLFDLYGAARVDFGPLWYDDAHVELSTVGKLTTALMARRLLQSHALSPLRSKPDG